MKIASAQGLTDEVARFQTDLRRLALQIVETVFRRELEGRKQELARPARRPPGRPPKQKAAPQPIAKGKRGPKAKLPKQSKRQTDRQLALGLAAAPAPVEPVAPPPAPTPVVEPDARLGGKRKKWTREAIVDALAHWLVNGNAVDASYVTRHGPPGLAAAARRIFGRFDAALNVASLHVAKLYPDGPPPKNASARAAAAAAAASAAQNQSA